MGSAFETRTMRGGKEDGKKFVLVPRWAFWTVEGLLIGRFVTDILLLILGK